MFYSLKKKKKLNYGLTTVEQAAAFGDRLNTQQGTQLTISKNH